MLNAWPWILMIEEAPSVNQSCHGSNCIISANSLGEGINIKAFVMNYILNISPKSPSRGFWRCIL